MVLVNFATKKGRSVPISIAGVVQAKHAARSCQLDKKRCYQTVIFPLRQSSSLHTSGFTEQNMRNSSNTSKVYRIQLSSFGTILQEKFVSLFLRISVN